MQLVEQLRHDAQWRKREDIEWLVLERPGAALLHHFDGVESVCLIDALEHSEQERVERIELGDLLPGEITMSSHNFGVAETVQLAAALKQLPPRLLIYGVTDYPDCYADLATMLANDLTG